MQKENGANLVSIQALNCDNVSVFDHGELCRHPRGSSMGLPGSDFMDFFVIAAEEPLTGVQNEFDHVVQVLLVWVRPKKGEVDLDSLLLALWPKERQKRAQVELIERFLQRKNNDLRTPGLAK